MEMGSVTQNRYAIRRPNCSGIEETRFAARILMILISPGPPQEPASVLRKFFLILAQYLYRFGKRRCRGATSSAAQVADAVGDRNKERMQMSAFEPKRIFFVYSLAGSPRYAVVTGEK